MLNSEFYDRVLVKARRAGDTALRAPAINETLELMQSWENSPFHPWFLEKVSVGVVATPGSQTLNLPADFLLTVEDTNWYTVSPTDGAKKVLYRGYHEDLILKFKDAAGALPKGYDYFAGLIYLGPKPDLAYTLDFKYYAKQTAPPDNGDTLTNQWILNAQALCVVAVAQRLMENYIKDYKRADGLKVEEGTLRSELHKYNEARKHADMDYNVDR
jgi:hypothetical protein